VAADEIAPRDEFDFSPTTVRKYLARYDFTDVDAENVTYGRLDELGDTEPETEQTRT